MKAGAVTSAVDKTDTRLNRKPYTSPYGGDSPESPAGRSMCALCQLPLKSPETKFCCSGCAQVAEILESAGYQGDPRQSVAFQQAFRAGAIAQASNDGAASESTAGSANNCDLALSVEGMTCPSCAWLIETVLSCQPGVRSTRVNFLAERAEVTFDPALTGRVALAEKIGALGYRVTSENRSNSHHGLLIRLGVAAALEAQIMMLSYAHFHRLDAGSALQSSVWVGWLIALLTAVLIAGPGMLILRRAFAAVRSGAVTMDGLIALGSLGAYGFSIEAAWRGNQEVYFEVAAALITLSLLGKLIERAAFRRTEHMIAGIRGLLPRKALRLDSSGAKWVDACRVKTGDRIRVDPGSRVPLDGYLLDKEAMFSTASVDGEPCPRSLGRGALIHAGSTNGAMAAELEVAAPATGSLLSRIADHVAGAGASESGSEVTDALARLLLPLMLLLAVVTAAAWSVNGLPFYEAFRRGLAVLVVSCPCALAVAAPLARVVSAAALARRGIVVRGDGAMDAIARARCVAFDKTGTLTTGELVLERVETDGATAEFTLELLATIESRTQHPIAQTIRQVCARTIPARSVNVSAVPGEGIHGTIDGDVVAAGRPSWITSRYGSVPDNLEQVIRGAKAAAKTVVLLAWKSRICAAFVFSDTIRDDAAGALLYIRSAGLETAVLSGDAPEPTERVAHALGIDEAASGMTPDGKARWLTREKSKSGNTPIFVGDGINDAPALAASVGIAVASSTDFARESAAVLLISPNLNSIPVLITTARRTTRIIRQNLTWAISYNATAIPLAAVGLLSPVIAAAAMVGSSLVVTLNSLRLCRIDKPGR